MQFGTKKSCWIKRPLLIGSIGLGLVVGSESLGPNCIFGQQRISSEKIFGQNVHRFFDGQYDDVINQTSLAIEAGSIDPRLYYFRGLAHSQMGNTVMAEMDFEQGAILELRQEGKRNYNIGRSLMRVQGASRMMIEDARSQARLNRNILQADAMAERRSISDVNGVDGLRQNGAARGDFQARPNLPDVSRVNDPSAPFAELAGSAPDAEINGGGMKGFTENSGGANSTFGQGDDSTFGQTLKSDETFGAGDETFGAQANSANPSDADTVPMLDPPNVPLLEPRAGQDSNNAFAADPAAADPAPLDPAPLDPALGVNDDGRGDGGKVDGGSLIGDSDPFGQSDDQSPAETVQPPIDDPFAAPASGNSQEASDAAADPFMDADPATNQPATEPGVDPFAESGDDSFGADPSTNPVAPDTNADPSTTQPGDADTANNSVPKNVDSGKVMSKFFGALLSPVQDATRQGANVIQGLPNMGGPGAPPSEGPGFPPAAGSNGTGSDGTEPAGNDPFAEPPASNDPFADPPASNDPFADPPANDPATGADPFADPPASNDPFGGN